MLKLFNMKQNTKIRLELLASITIILTANLIFVLFARIYVPNIFHPQTVSFLENYCMVAIMASVMFLILIVLGGLASALLYLITRIYVGARFFKLNKFGKEFKLFLKQNKKP